MVLADGLNSLGTMPWETKVGHVAEHSLPVMDKIFTGYGDQPDQVSSRDGACHSTISQVKYMREGVSYLKQTFPDMDYIVSCSSIADPRVNPQETEKIDDVPKSEGAPEVSWSGRAPDDHTYEWLGLFVLGSVAFLVVLLPRRLPPGITMRRFV